MKLHPDLQDAEASAKIARDILKLRKEQAALARYGDNPKVARLEGRIAALLRRQAELQTRRLL